MARLTDMISGAIATFRTPGKQDIRSLKVHFSPVQEGTGDPSPTNVRPVSGWTGVKAYRAGANLLPEELLADFDNYSNRGNYGYFYTDPIQLAPNTTYHLGWTRTTEDSDPLCYWGVKSYSGAGYGVADAGTFQYYCNGGNGLKAYTSFNSGETGKIRFALNKNSSQYATAQDALDDLFAKAKFTLNAGTTASEYEPYKEPLTLPLDWTDSAGTVYGGYVDLVTGEVVQQYVSRGIDELGITAPSSGTSEPWTHRFSIRGGWITGVGYENAPGAFDWYCNVFEKANAYTNGTGLSGAGVLYLYDDTVNTVAEFKEKYKDIQLVYQVRAAAEIRTTLTPTALRTLIGTNNIWSNANGNVDVEYDFAESREMMEARKRALGYRYNPWKLVWHNSFDKYQIRNMKEGSVATVMDNGEWLKEVSNGQNNNGTGVYMNDRFLYNDIKDKLCRITYTIECDQSVAFDGTNIFGNITLGLFSTKTTPSTTAASKQRVSKIDIVTYDTFLGHHSVEFVPSELFASLTKSDYLGWNIGFRSSIDGLTIRVTQLDFEVKK